MTATETSDPRHGRTYRASYTATVPGEKPTGSHFRFRFDSRKYVTPEGQAWAKCERYCARYGFGLVKVTISNRVRPLPVVTRPDRVQCGHLGLSLMSN